MKQSGPYLTPSEQYSFAEAGRARLAKYERGEALPDLILPIPLFLLQHHAKWLPAKEEEEGSDDHADDTDSEREDLLEDGQRFIQRGSETLYIPQSVVGERLVGKKLEYRIRWQKWHDLSWEKADGRVSSGTWRDTPVVAAWEAAKHSGSLLPHVCLQFKLSPRRRGISIGAQLEVGLVPSPSTAELPARADPAAAEQQ
eukprot:944253-Prymnesium_polylepis.1